MRKQIHIVNPMTNLAGGSEWRIYELCRLLAPHADVHLWSFGGQDFRWSSGLNIRSIPSIPLNPPAIEDGGTFVFVGAYYHWLPHLFNTTPSRVVVIYNVNTPYYLNMNLGHLQERWPGIPVEFVFASKWLRNSTHKPGVVQPSIIDISRFAPTNRSGRSSFTIGRHSRDDISKHNQNDLSLYVRLHDLGIRTRVLGGNCLSSRYKTVDLPPDIELLAECQEEAPLFLHTLDCFFFRTHTSHIEAHGRCVQEAMACGLPVVCHRQGGQAEYIAHGQNGFVFDTEDEAIEIIKTLARDLDLRARIGEAARSFAEELFSPESLRQIADFYLQGSRHT